MLNKYTFKSKFLFLFFIGLLFQSICIYIYDAKCLLIQFWRVDGISFFFILSHVYRLYRVKKFFFFAIIPYRCIYSHTYYALYMYK